MDIYIHGNAYIQVSQQFLYIFRGCSVCKQIRANVRRAVSEGLRVWMSRSFFKDNPKVAIQLLSALKSDSSEYVRKSVGNALRMMNLLNTICTVKSYQVYVKK